MILYLWPDDAFGGGWNDVYSLPREMLMEIYMVYLFIYTAVALHHIHCIGIYIIIPLQFTYNGIFKSMLNELVV